MAKRRIEVKRPRMDPQVPVGCIRSGVGLKLGPMSDTTALVLFSGGIDSTSALYWARSQFEHVTALTVDYGQRHRIEVKMAAKILDVLGIPGKNLRMDLTQIGGSALTDEAIGLPKYAGETEIRPDIPPTYVPFRNGILLSLAAGWAEVTAARHLVCGFNVLDSPNYPDTTPAFVQAMETAINTGTRAAFEPGRYTLHAPFSQQKKSEIIRQGLELGADYAYSVSCYAGDEVPCMKCSSCWLRQKAWQEVGVKDHLLARLEKEGRL